MKTVQCIEKNYNKEIKINDKADEVIEKLFQKLLKDTIKSYFY